MLSAETGSRVAHVRSLRGLEGAGPPGPRRPGAGVGRSSESGESYVAAPSLRTRRGMAAMAAAMGDGKGEPLAAEVRALLEAVWSGREAVYEPADLLRAVWMTMPHFAARNQEQDAHEFLQCMLETMSRELRCEQTGRPSKRLRDLYEPPPLVDLTDDEVAKAKAERDAAVAAAAVVTANAAAAVAAEAEAAAAAPAAAAAVAARPAPTPAMAENAALSPAGMPVLSEAETEVQVEPPSSGEEGFWVTSRWGPKRHASGCVCRSCKRQRRELRAGTKKARGVSMGGAAGANSYGAAVAAAASMAPAASAAPATAPPSAPDAAAPAASTATPAFPPLPPSAKTPPPPILGVAGSTDVVATSPKLAPLSPTPRDDPMFGLFGGVILSRICCGRCSATTEIREPFTDLSIPIPRSSRAPSAASGSGGEGATAAATFELLNRGGADAAEGGIALEECLRTYTSAEELDGHGYTCGTCGHTCGTKHTEIVELPKVLCLHLKRFECQVGGDVPSAAAPTVKEEKRQDGSVSGSDGKSDEEGKEGAEGKAEASGGGGGAVAQPASEGGSVGGGVASIVAVSLGVVDKIGAPVTFPLSGLDMSPHLNASRRTQQGSTVYDLSGVVKHHGARVDSGHYTAMAHNEHTRQWLSFNDDKIEECRAADADHATRAYLFVYSRREADI